MMRPTLEEKMKTFATMIAAAGLALGASLPAFADDMAPDIETLTCAQFTSLTPDEQADAIVRMKTAVEGTGGTTTSSGADATSTTTAEVKGNTETGSDSDVTTLQSMCAGKEDMMAKDVLGGM
jgi:hypothetical protein